MRKIWDIPGGVHPPENKQQSVNAPIGSIPLPSEIILPLNQHIGGAAMPIVKVGEHVKKGQKIAEAQGLVSAPVHASTSGTINAVEDRFVPHPSGMSAPCIVIQPDGDDSWCSLNPCEDYLSLSHNTLIEKIRDAGIAGMGGAGFPSAVKLNPRADHIIDTLILNGTECEPYITADDVLMRERAVDIVAGAELLAYILGPSKHNRAAVELETKTENDKTSGSNNSKSLAHIIIGIEDNKPEAIAAMREAAKDSVVEIVSFPTKYPSGGEKQLIQILTGKEVPSGGIPAQIGIVVQNIGTAVAAYRAARYGEPLISRVTTVVGESLTTQRNIEVLLGTPVAHVLAEHGFQAERSARLIIGGPMMGFAMEQTDVPVIKTTNCVLVPSKQEMPEQPAAQPCIRCGMCAEACPASLLPQQLLWFSQSEDVDKLKSHHLFDCIECGACSYVCPSNIPLVQYYRASKGMIRHIESEKEKSDRSRQRFEFRQERIDKAEAEKEAKRAARKKAAEEAKKKLAEQQASGEDTSKPSSPPMVKTDEADNLEAQRAKLARALTSAEGRVERASGQIETAKAEGQDSRLETLAARLKQAEQKRDDAKAKLESFDRDGAAASSPAQSVGKPTGSEKPTMSPAEKQQKTIDTLKKRIATAEQKLAEAEQAGASTTDALRNGVEKLRSKLLDAEKERDTLSQSASEAGNESPVSAGAETDKMRAAEMAIEKAKANAAAQANMSDEEKAKKQIESLKQRLEKARSRFEKAQKEDNPNVEAFKLGVEKLEKKLLEVEAQ